MVKFLSCFAAGCVFMSSVFAETINCDADPVNNCCNSSGDEWCLVYTGSSSGGSSGGSSDGSSGGGLSGGSSSGGSGGKAPVTGLIFPSNGELGWKETVRFKFTNPLFIQPATYIWKINLRQHAGYYTTFFWGNDGEFGGDYYGFHPYPNPPPSGSAHDWSVAASFTDKRGSQVEYGRWHTQVARVHPDGRKFEFYYDWPDRTKVIVQNFWPWEANGKDIPANPVLTFGDAPWKQNEEACSCTLRGLQVYLSLLNMKDIESELEQPGSVVRPWYLNINPMPDDISDKSGNGHDPVWHSSNRPGLYLVDPEIILSP